MRSPEQTVTAVTSGSSEARSPVHATITEPAARPTAPARRPDDAAPVQPRAGAARPARPRPPLPGPAGRASSGSTRPPSPAWSAELDGARPGPSTAPGRAGRRRAARPVGRAGRADASAASAPRSTSTTSAALALDLAGDVVAEHRVSLDTVRLDAGRGARPARRALVAAHLRRGRRPRRAARWPSPSASPAWSTPDRAVVTLAPNLGWHDVPVARLLRETARRRRRTCRWSSTTRPTSRRSPRPCPATRDRARHARALRRGRGRRRRRRRRPAAAWRPRLRRRVRPHDRRPAGPALRLRPRRAAGRP